MQERLPFEEYLRRLAVRWAQLRPDAPPSPDDLKQRWDHIDTSRLKNVSPEDLAERLAPPINSPPDRRRFRAPQISALKRVLYYVVRVERDRDPLKTRRETRHDAEAEAEEKANAEWEKIKRGWSVTIDAQTNDGRVRGLGLGKGFERS